jgi:hypothetical protein
MSSDLVMTPAYARSTLPGDYISPRISLPTPRTPLRAGYVRVPLSCRACQRSRDADLQALIDIGQGDVRMQLSWRCNECHSARIRHGLHVEGQRRGAVVKE